ncbi:hypothetical protein SprV_0401601200 [Sparganum proliferum]
MEEFLLRVYGSPTKGIAPLLIADGGTLLRVVLDRPSTISDAAIARLPQVEPNADLDLPPLSSRNHQGRATVLQRESSRIRRDPR